MTAGSSAAAALKRRFEWRGLWFYEEPTRLRAIGSSQEEERWECTEYPFRGKVVRFANGQWMASFEEGPYALAYDRDEALEDARLKAVDNLFYKTAMFQNLW